MMPDDPLKQPASEQAKPEDVDDNCDHRRVLLLIAAATWVMLHIC